MLSASTAQASLLWSALLLLGGWVRVNAGRSGSQRHLLDQLCPATYPISFAGTCYLCPEAYPFFLSRYCYVDQKSASTSSTSGAVEATSQPIVDPPTTSEVATTMRPAEQHSVEALSGGTTTTYGCTDFSQVLWNNNCYSCPAAYPYFNSGSCYSANPTVSVTNPNSASAAAAKQTAAGNNPNPGGGSLITGTGGGRRLKSWLLVSASATEN